MIEKSINLDSGVVEFSESMDLQVECWIKYGVPFEPFEEKVERGNNRRQDFVTVDRGEILRSTKLFWGSLFRRLAACKPQFCI